MKHHWRKSYNPPVVLLRHICANSCTPYAHIGQNSSKVSSKSIKMMYFDNTLSDFWPFHAQAVGGVGQEVAIDDKHHLRQIRKPKVPHHWSGRLGREGRPPSGRCSYRLLTRFYQPIFFVDSKSPERWFVSVAKC